MASLLPTFALRTHLPRRSMAMSAVAPPAAQSLYYPLRSARRFSSYSASAPSLPPPSLSRCQALGEGSPRSFDQTVYRGIYGPWKVEQEDVREVILYRCGLVTAAASFLLAASTAFLPEGNTFGDIIKQDIDFLFAAEAGGLGLSLLLIHIYVTPIKRFLQLLWLTGVFGSIALTGLVFKEGLCYGKLEAGILTFIIPSLLLGHLSGLMDNGSKLSLLGFWMSLFLVFAARKFQQPIKDDIGDKSVFIGSYAMEWLLELSCRFMQFKMRGLVD